MIMPSETVELPSFFTGDSSFPGERQVGFWKSDTMLDHHAIGKTTAMSPLENHEAVECQSAKTFELHQSFLLWDQKLNNSVGGHSVGTGRAVRQSSTLLRPMVQNPGTRSSSNIHATSYYPEGGKADVMATQFENSLFSSSLSELFSRKYNLSSNGVSYDDSVDIVASRFEEEEPFENLEEIEAQTIGNLLPSDDDLFSGMTDKLDKIQSNGRDDLEELDFFNSVGGLDLGDDGSTKHDIDFPGGISNAHVGFSNGSITGEHPYGEQPSRTLFVRNINSNIEDSELRAVFEKYGDIHTLYTSCKHRGFVMISYYDIRSASNAKEALQDTPLRRRKLDIHYSIPKDNPSEKDINEGTLVAVNLDALVPHDELLKIFGVYGEIKEIRGTSNRSQHKFIEFYDARDARNALCALNGTEIAGKRIKLELSRPAGSRRVLRQIPPELDQSECGPYLKQSSPPSNANTGIPGAISLGTYISNGIDSGTSMRSPSPTQARFLESAFHHGNTSCFPNSLSSPLRADSSVNKTGFSEPGHAQDQLNFDIQGSPNFQPHSLPDYHDGLKSVVFLKSPGSIANMSPKPHERIDNRQLQKISSNGNSVEFSDGGFSSAVNGSSSLPAHHYSWGNTYPSQPPSMMWPNSPSSVNGISMGHPSARIHGPPRAPAPVLNSVLPVRNHNAGSSPTANASLWHRRRAFAGESPDNGFHPGSLGSLRISNNSVYPIELISPNMYPCVAGNYMDLSIPRKNMGLQPHHQRSPGFPGRSQLSPITSPFDSPNERARSRRNEGSINLMDKKMYELDIDRILQGEDNRTTLMIKNIPNKYTSKMLLAAIDERHKGTYDFIYLPIDFKNKCNVGYAFINMTDPSQIIPFYQAFNGKKWEKFNSEKVASLAYARIQGKAALIAHFQNSSLMNEDKRCRPILFNTDGPNAGDQVPFPVGVNVRTRPGKSKTITHEENHLGGTPDMSNKENSSNGAASSGFHKESDQQSQLLLQPLTS